jgi:tRNA(fMet)-specific endonuclease VapC
LALPFSDIPLGELVAKQPNQQVLDWLDAQITERLYLSIITLGEIAKGISKLLHLNAKIP